ncbi:nucleotidyltransferase domain-containing protein [Mangrovimonas sp. TPBH4]|uniref:nucleotidyltransferase domain-containing protein n=1 Tax=Mangrovimonas sp. TPBH4 TaxID=1645914 RepID=UPI0006B63A58|nr:nucleotidyltransferase domain-containing protein [Mangrovimonas sp. TPBH4]
MEALKTILYFSIFNYPITKEEVYRFSGNKCRQVIDTQLELLISKNIISQNDNYYIFETNVDCIQRRQKGNKMAQDIMPKACKVAKFITKFPYVESVSLSGSLSKGYYDDDGDIDFFIITKPNRLWIARTLLILYKKLFLLNSRKYFCVNYFISNDNLLIEEQNRFTATELLTLIPITGKKCFKKFVATNAWAKTYLPNLDIDYSHKITNIKKPWLSKNIQMICDGNFGEMLDHFFKSITIKKWQSKFRHLTKEELLIALKSTDTVSKHHPQNFQKKVIDTLNEKYLEVKNEFNLELSPEHA